MEYNKEDHITWDVYFMGVAKLSSLRSKDCVTKVGACIINSQNRIVGIGYNGMPYGCEDEKFPWGKEGKYVDTKYAYVVHAEPNAILNATVPLNGSTMYVTEFPCNECAKLIIQSGISKIIYLSDKYIGTDSNIASKRMLDAANVVLIQIEDTKVCI